MDCKRSSGPGHASKSLSPLLPPPLILIALSSSALSHLNPMKKIQLLPRGKCSHSCFHQLWNCYWRLAYFFPRFAQFQTIAPHCSPSCHTNERLRGGKTNGPADRGLGKHIPPAAAQRDGKKQTPAPHPICSHLAGFRGTLSRLPGVNQVTLSTACSPAPTGRARSRQRGLKHLLL